MQKEKANMADQLKQEKMQMNPQYEDVPQSAEGQVDARAARASKIEKARESAKLEKEQNLKKEEQDKNTNNE